MSGGTLVEVELLSGRYHAHVWGEAQFGMAGPEWPPSPWRLLRSLAAAWFDARPAVSSDRDRDALLERLGRAGPPEIWLPPASFHEIRYYQPIKLGASDRVLHHDFYAVPEGGRFWFHFSVGLTLQERTLLAKLLGRLRYFGRSESRASLRVVELAEPPRGVYRVNPRGTGTATIDAAYRRVLCTASDFRAADPWSVRDGPLPTANGGHPPHLVDTLLQKKMPLPCGARWVEYALPMGILVHEIQPSGMSLASWPSEPKVAEIHFRLNRRIPIPIGLLVAVARAFRDAAVRRHTGLTGGDSTTLSGRAQDGSVSRGHRHAYYMPQFAEDRLHVEKLVVRVPTGRLTRAELDALLGVERIRLGGGAYPVTVVAENVVAELGPQQRASRWRSSTPFLPPLRHRRDRCGTCVEQHVAASIERSSGLRPAHIRVEPGPAGSGRITPLLSHQYANMTSEAGRHWTLTRRLGFWLSLSFDEPVALSVPVGADAHFGAGQFEPW